MKKTKFRKFISILLTVIMVLSVSPVGELAGIDLAGLFPAKASAEYGTYSGTWSNGDLGSGTWVYYSYTYILEISGSGILGKIDFESSDWQSISECSVRIVHVNQGITETESSFIGLALLNSVTLPNSLTVIGSSTFAGNRQLRAVNFPANLTTVGDYAFSQCKLSSVVLPDSVTTIGDGAFTRCDSLESITLSDNLTSIGVRAFYGCKVLESITLPDNLISIGAEAFYGCSALALDLEMPDSITEIGNRAFCNCSSLTGLGISSGITNLNRNILDGCTSVQNINVHSGNPVYDSRNNCNAVIETATGKLLIGCNNTVIPGNITSIGEYAFYYSPALSSVTIPDSVTNIDSTSFRNCSGLESITVAGGNTVYDSRNGCNAIIETGGNWLLTGCKNTVIPDGVKGILTFAFSGCTGLTDIVFPDSLYLISAYAFLNCTALETVTFPEKLSSLGDFAFKNCTSLKTVDLHLDRSFGGLGESAFQNCSSLESATVVLDGMSTKIGAYAFADCKKLKTVSLKAGIICDNAFLGCEALESVDLYYGISLIEKYAFSLCDSLAEINYYGEESTWQDVNIEESGNEAFLAAAVNNMNTGECGAVAGTVFWTIARRNNYTRLTISGNGRMQDWGPSEAPWYGRDVGEVVIETGVISIGSNAFRGDTDLATVRISASVTEIGEYAFDGCSSMYRVDFDGTQAQYNQLVIGTGNTELTDTVTNFTASGECGAVPGTLFWSLDIRGYMTITGSGIMPDWTEENPGPWSVLRNVKYVTIEEGVENVGKYAFYNCEALYRIDFPESLKSIGEGAFKDCTGLCWAYLKDGLESIGDYAFENTHLKQIEIPDTVTSVGDYAYYNCLEIVNVTLPRDLTSIGEYTFYGCTDMETLRIVGNLTGIGAHALENCEKLEQVSLPDTLTCVGTDAFKGCTGLEYVWYKGTAQQWNGVNLTTGNGCLNDVGPTICSGDCGAVPGTVFWSIDNYENFTVTGSGDMKDYGYRDEEEVEVEVAVEDVFPVWTWEPWVKNVVVEDGVTSIGAYAFAMKSKLVSVTLPDSVTVIGTAAFNLCINISSINVPRQLTTIGPAAFSNCLSLTEFVLPDTVTSIGFGAFMGSGLTSFVIPDGITSIEELTFASTKITHIDIPDSVERIEYQAFAYTPLESVIIPGTVISVGEGAFEECRSLSEVEIMSGVRTLEKSAFARDYNLSQVSLPDTLTSIGDWAFQGDRSLTEITLPDSLQSIGNGAFESCSHITSIVLPPRLTRINFCTFCECDSLESVTFYSGIIEVERSAFSGASAISDVYYYGTREQYDNIIIDNDGNERFGYATVHLCGAAGGIWENGSLGSGTWALDGNGVLTLSGTGALPDRTFEESDWYENNSPTVRSVVIRNGITEIGSMYFGNCTVLESVTFGSTLSKIGEMAFTNCSSLCEIDLPDSLTEIGDYAFASCTALENITLPAGVTQLGEAPFAGSPALSSVTVDSANSVFDSRNNCNAIIDSQSNELILGCKNTVIPNSVTRIGDYAFANCTGMTAITIPAGVTGIGDDAFYGCSALSAVVIPEGVTEAGANAFSCCESLESVTVPGSLTCTGAYMFSECHALSDVTVSGGVETVSNGTFYGCTALEQITFPVTLTEIGDYAFTRCSSFTDVYYAGTKAQWNNIAVGSSGNEVLASSTIHCSDGIIKFVTVTLDANGGYCSEESITVSADGNYGTLPVPERSGMTFLGWYYGDTPVENNNQLVSGSGHTLTAKWGTHLFNLKSFRIPFADECIGTYVAEMQENMEPVSAGINQGMLIAALYDSDGTEYGASSTAVFETDETYYVMFGVVPSGMSEEEIEALQPYATQDGGNSFASTGIRTQAGRGAFYFCNSETFTPKYGGTWSNGALGHGIWTFEQNGGVLTVSGTGKLPDYNTGYPEWYNRYYETVGTVEISEGITGIGNWYFYDCYNIASVSLPSTLTEIGESVFKDCYGLESIEIPGGVTTVGKEAFYGCNNLTGITLPESLTGLNDGLFYNCTSLISVEIPAGVTSVGEKVFENCTALENITVNENNTVFDSRNNCNAIIRTSDNTLIAGCKNTVIPSDVTGIFYYAFYACSGLASVALPDGLEWIGDEAFYGCSALQTLEIPEGVSSVGYGAFKDCNSLKSVTVPSTLQTIFEETFSGCVSLESISFLYDSGNGNGVHSIEKNAFYNCRKLSDVYFDGYKSDWDLVNIDLGDSFLTRGNSWLIDAEMHFKWCSMNNDEGHWSFNQETGKLTVEGEGLVDYYGAASQWHSYSDRITSVELKEGITAIGSSAFNGYSAITSVSLPGTLTEIGSYAFRDCTSVTSVYIPSGVTSVGFCAFLGCTGVEEITVDGGNTVYDSREGCNAIIETATGTLVYGCENTVIPDGITTIGEGAFSGYSGLTVIEIPASVTVIENAAFDECYNVTDVYFAGSPAQWNAIQIGTNNYMITTGATMHYNTAGTWENGPDGNGTWKFSPRTGVLTIEGTGEMHYYNDGEQEWREYEDDVTSVIVGEGITYLGDRVFIMDRIETVSLPDSLTAIGDYAFIASSLRSLSLPANLRYFGEGITDYCADLTEITVDKNNPYYDSREGCNAVIYTENNELVLGCKTTVIPDTVTSVGYGAFECSMTLTEIEIPASITEIGEYAFYECDSLTDVYYLGSQAQWNQISIDDYNTALLNASLHCLGERNDVTATLTSLDAGKKIKTIKDIRIMTGLGLSEAKAKADVLPSVILTGADYETAVFSKYLFAVSGADLALSGHPVIPGTVSYADGVTYNPETGYLYGFNPGMHMLGDAVNSGHLYVNVYNAFDSQSSSNGTYMCLDSNLDNVFGKDKYIYEVSDKTLGTGKLVLISDGEEIKSQFITVIFGDVNGDGVYDGTDAILVSCMANGMLTEAQVGPAAWAAADVNHDGTINSADVAILEQAGILLAQVDQLSEEELATSSVYQEYLTLIDQNPEADETSAESTQPADETTDAPADFFSMLVTFIKSVITMIMNFIFPKV